jgi:predicted metal-dependent hydrolase
LELLWRATPGPERWLYQGILQVGVGLHHLRRRNRRGAVALLERGLRLLSAYPDGCQGVNVQALRRQTEAIRSFLVAEGPAGLESFDWSLAPKIEITSLEETEL